MARLLALLSPDRLRSGPLVGVAAVLFFATAMLAWFGYDGTIQSRRNVRRLLEGRQAEQLALLWAGLGQDMKGAQSTILGSVEAAQVILDPPFDLADTFARGFARFPYPESFFAWKAEPEAAERTYVFNRADRLPAWQTPPRLAGPYPVEVVRAPEPMRQVIELARQRSRYNRPFTVFDADIGGVPYQIVVRFFYADDFALASMVGFSVNLPWVRQEYFTELVRQMARIGGEGKEVALSIADERGAVVTASQPQRLDIAPLTRAFPMFFADRALIGVPPIDNSDFIRWSARAGAGRGSAEAAAATATNAAFFTIAFATAAMLIGLVIIVGAARTAAALAAMKSDFVSGITHELKTPLALIALVAETFVKRRYDSSDTMQDYAKLLAHESRNLTRLIDNLLTYAGLSDIRHAYAFEPSDVMDLVDDVMQQFHVILADTQFAVSVEMPSDLPPVRADRAALKLALDNVIDNAIKYSTTTRTIQVEGRVEGPFVEISVADRGAGIPADEINRVCGRFFRGRGVSSRGSGMGLAITRMIVEAHGGHLSIESILGVGTRVHVFLPAAEGA
jgi:signal transduction histidine kinase